MPLYFFFLKARNGFLGKIDLDGVTAMDHVFGLGPDAVKLDSFFAQHLLQKISVRQEHELGQVSVKTLVS